MKFYSHRRKPCGARNDVLGNIRVNLEIIFTDADVASLLRCTPAGYKLSPAIWRHYCTSVPQSWTVLDVDLWKMHHWKAQQERMLNSLNIFRCWPYEKTGLRQPYTIVLPTVHCFLYRLSFANYPQLPPHLSPLFPMSRREIWLSWDCRAWGSHGAGPGEATVYVTQQDLWKAARLEGRRSWRMLVIASEPTCYSSSRNPRI